MITLYGARNWIQARADIPITETHIFDWQLPTIIAPPIFLCLLQKFYPKIIYIE